MYDNYDALIFDMDGTLVDSGPLHERAWTVALEKYSVPVDRVLMRSLAGVPTKETFEILLKKFAIKTRFSAVEMSAFKEHWVLENLYGYVKPTALIEVVMKYHGKKRMAVGTGAQTAEAAIALKICGLADFMEVVVGADQVGHPKPAPDTFLRCAALLDVPAKNCVVFEDSKVGLQAAASAGMAGVDVWLSHEIKNDYFL